MESLCLFYFHFRQDCVFTKNFSDTALHVYWTGALKIHNCNSCCKRWYFTFNGAECSGPLPIDGVVFMSKGPVIIYRLGGSEDFGLNTMKFSRSPL